MRRKQLACVILSATVFSVGCHRLKREDNVLSEQQVQQAVAQLRAAYAAFNRGDIEAAVRSLDTNVEWLEPAEFPGGGVYHGIDGAKRYLAQSRANAAELISEPEQFIPFGDRIIVFVHARVRPRENDGWQDVKLADVYTFRDGKVTQMRAFANRDEALRWSGAAK
jgi:ketosteroid isomerase-like protein